MPKRVLNKKIGKIAKRLASVERFDPSAFDGDDDGRVQDGTQYERPAIKRRAKRKTESRTPKQPSKRETLATAGGLSGRMANENPKMGSKIQTEITPDGPSSPKKTSLKVKYGELSEKVDVSDSYSDWTDAYSQWVAWKGNYSMRVASHALMGLPLPSAYGYMGENNPAHEHQIISTGKVPKVSEKKNAIESIKNAIVALLHINSGKERNTTPIYRGLHDVARSEAIMRAKPGQTLDMGLSAFTPSLDMAVSFAINPDSYDSGTPDNDLIVEIRPGAKIGLAAGEEYLFEYNDNGKWVTGITEAVTQGRFSVVSVSHVPINAGGRRAYVKKVTLEQIGTFNPVTSSFEKRSSSGLRGAMSRSSDVIQSIETIPDSKERKRILLQRVDEIRDALVGAFPQNSDELIRRSTPLFRMNNVSELKYVETLSKQYDLRNGQLFDALGNKLTKEEYIAQGINSYINNIDQIMYETLVDRPQADFSPQRIDDLRNIAEYTFLIYPHLFDILKKEGMPTFVFWKKAEVADPKTGETRWMTIDDAKSRGLPFKDAAVTARVSKTVAVVSMGSQNFVDRSRTPRFSKEEIDKTLWSFPIEEIIEASDGNPAIYERERITRLIDEDFREKREMFSTAHTPAGLLSHELVHVLHAFIVERMAAEEFKKSKQEIDIPGFVDASAINLDILRLFHEMSWSQSAHYNFYPGRVADIMSQPVTQYALSAPVEWVAETLGAVLSPSPVLRERVGQKERSILMEMFPELRPYLMRDAALLFRR